MQKFTFIAKIFVLFCIFSFSSTEKHQAKEIYEIPKYENSYNYFELDTNSLEHGSSQKVEVKQDIVYITIEKEYKPAIVFPEFENVDREPDYRVQSPRRCITGDDYNCRCGIGGNCYISGGSQKWIIKKKLLKYYRI